MSEDVSLGDTAAGPGGGDAGDVDAFLGHQATDRRRRRQSRFSRGAGLYTGPWVPGGDGAAVAAVGDPAGSIVADRRTDRHRLAFRPIFRTPELGAGTTLLALSVSSSNSGSPALTESPSGLSQRARIPSEIDSPTLGTVIAGTSRHVQLTPGRTGTAARLRIDEAETR